jgi:hypothetical protein
MDELRLRLHDDVGDLAHVPTSALTCPGRAKLRRVAELINP